MRTLLIASLLFTAACTDDRTEFIGSYDTTASMTIVREDGTTLSFASPEASVLVGENGDDNAVSLSVYANRGASLTCSMFMIAVDDTLVLDANYSGTSDCQVCDESRTNCWTVDSVSATGTLVGDQLTLTTSGAANNAPDLDEGTASATLSGSRSY